MSIAGGLTKALDQATQHGCATLQLFTKSASQWQARPLSEAEIAAFRQQLAAGKFHHATAHDSYLINLASPDDALYQKSIAAFIEELHRANSLGLKYLVMHPGAHTGSGEVAGLARVAKALDQILDRCPSVETQVLLETTAGQGSTLGHRFEHLASILDQMHRGDQLGVCLDTCHIFAAGYDLRTPEAYYATFRRFQRLLGMRKLKMFHVNDSVKPLGSRVDRHAHLGQGQIGLEAFRLLVNDGRFRRHPMILETPKTGPNGEAMDPQNLGVLRDLYQHERLLS